MLRWFRQSINIFAVPLRFRKIFANALDTLNKFRGPHLIEPLNARIIEVLKNIFTCIRIHFKQNYILREDSLFIQGEYRNHRWVLQKVRLRGVIGFSHENRGCDMRVTLIKRTFKT